MVIDRKIVEFPENSNARMGKAISLFEAGNYSDALPALTSLIDENETHAYAYVGNIFERGGGSVSSDFKKARFYYDKAADCGDVEGYLGLGRIFYYGKGITKNRQEAFRLYSNLEDAGFKSPTVSLMLGRMYEIGDGIAKNHEKARRYYEDASRSGNVIALSYLASSKIAEGCYLEGLFLKLRATVTALILGVKDPNDIRLKSS